MNKTIEILAPCGNMDNLIAATRAGANAVYLGVSDFNARNSAQNFTLQTLKEAVSYCHARNVKVNVTLNTILYDTELEKFKQTVKEVALCGVDAVIVQDLAAAKIVKEIAPTLALHASTQMAVHNLEGAIFLKEQGFQRVILARELSFGQVKNITENSGVETEVFIHGALCVSLSGQCYASAFLGGRSGNRGRCAGTCRLPFSSGDGQEDYHLSLKDLSAMSMLSDFEKIGVSSIKIEGRLRSAEYVAAATQSAKKALNNEEYDEKTLKDVFSRQGFTNEFLQGIVSSDAFGRRTKDDAKNTKEVLPKIREIYRREGQFVPIEFSFIMKEEQSILTLREGDITKQTVIDKKVEDAKSCYKTALITALSKLGGTPFYLDKINTELIDGKYLPLNEVNNARRFLIEELMKEKEKITPHIINEYEIPKPNKTIRNAKFILRFEDTSQIPDNISGINTEYIIIPLSQFNKINEGVKQRVILELPRLILNDIENVKQTIKKAKEVGFDKFYIHNTGHIPLVRNSKIISSFALNISNSLSAQIYKDFDVEIICLSPEITLEQIANINTDNKTAVFAYGHMPLMLFKSCPLLNERDCASCNQKGILTDRINKEFVLLCKGKKQGYRELFNPNVIYLGDRQREVNANFMILSFTYEEKERVKEVIEMFKASKKYDGEFTRGLYYKASI